jgi:hypothetical protein
MLTLIMEKADERDRSFGPKERVDSYGLGFRKSFACWD